MKFFLFIILVMIGICLVITNSTFTSNGIIDCLTNECLYNEKELEEMEKIDEKIHSEWAKENY